jgi:methylated-DNA-[protein]-cysteine S-methyltransferase
LKDKQKTSYSLTIYSPIGPLKLEADDTALTAIKFSVSAADAVANHLPPIDLLEAAKNQLNEYFSGDRTTFDLPLQPTGTPFEQSVWNKLMKIPYGASITYKQLAQKLGDVNKVRAVGRANGQNPLPVVIPCHRVIGADQKLIGYAGGIERKRWLLQHEGAILI